RPHTADVFAPRVCSHRGKRSTPAIDLAPEIPLELRQRRSSLVKTRESLSPTETMPSVEGKENVDGQILLPVSCAAAGGGSNAVPATKQSSCGGVGPRSGIRKPSRRIAALGCSSNSVGSNLQAGVVRAPSTSASAASAAAAAGCPAADSAQQSRALVPPTRVTISGKSPARPSSRAVKPPPNSKEATDGSAYSSVASSSIASSSVASSSVVSVMETRKPKRSAGSGAAAAAAAGLDKSRKSVSRGGGAVLSSPVPLPCTSSSNNGRKKTSKKRNLATTRDGARRGQEGRKAPQRTGV
ncbi:unnamed protein product, partial [Laminaria digitata]